MLPLNADSIRHKQEKLCTRVASCVAERIKELGNMKISKLGRDVVQSSFSSRNNILLIAVKNYASVDVKVLRCCPVLLDFFTLCQIFCPRNKCENKFSLNIYSSLLQTSMFLYFYIKEVTEKFQTEQFLVDAILHFQVRSESDTRRLSTLVVASFSERT